MRKNDRTFVLGALLMTVLLGLWSQLMAVPEGASSFADFITFAAVTGGLYFIYKGRDQLGGETARSLEVLGSGLLIYVLAYWPSYKWSVAGSPAWFGLSTDFWTILFALGNFVGLGIVAYGFYTFWEIGQ